VAIVVEKLLDPTAELVQKLQLVYIGLFVL
jgi:hypothetical protein